jgi:hypothetical protein
MSLLDRILRRGDSSDEQYQAEKGQNFETQSEPIGKQEVEKETEERDLNNEFGIPEDQLTDTDQDIMNMDPVEREEYLISQDPDELIWLTENSAGVVPKIVGEAMAREINLSEVAEKTTDPDFWTGNPQARKMLEQTIEEADHVAKEDAVGEVDTRAYPADTYGELQDIVGELFDRDQYEAATQFGEFVDRSYSFTELDPVQQLAVEEVVDRTEKDSNGRGKSDDKYKELFALIDAVDQKEEITLGKFVDSVDASDSDLIDQERVDEYSHIQRKSLKNALKSKREFSVEDHTARQFVDQGSDITEKAQEKKRAYNTVSEAFFEMETGGSYESKAKEAVRQFTEMGEYKEAALTATRFELEDDIEEVVKEASPRETYELASSLQGADGFEMSDDAMDDVGEYVESLVGEGQYNQAQDVVSEFEVSDRVGPKTRIELRKLEAQ